MIAASVVECIGWTLLHSVWQLTLLASLYGMSQSLLRGRNPQVRYAVAGVTLLVMLVCPLGTLAWLAARTAASSPHAFAQAEFADAVAARRDRLEEPLRSAAGELLSMDLAAPLNAESIAEGNDLAQWTHVLSHDANTTTMPRTSDAVRHLRSIIDPLLPTLVGVWIVGVLLLSCRHLGGWWVVTRLRRRGALPSSPSLAALTAALGQRLGLRHSVTILESLWVQVPCAMGWLRPAILMPLGLASRLPPDQLEAILLHELAHILRRDCLANGLQIVTETLLFYHPGVWWVSRRMRLEREHCADELAAKDCGNRLLYASALMTLEEQRAFLPGWAVAANGSDLRRRIEHILGVDRRAPRHTLSWLSGLITLLLLAVAAGSFPSGEINAHDGAPAAVAGIESSSDCGPTTPSPEAITSLALPPQRPSGEILDGAESASQLWTPAVQEKQGLLSQLGESLSYVVHDFLEAALAPTAPIVREYFFQVQSTDGQPVAGATVTFTGLGLPSGSSVGGFPGGLVPTATSDAKGMIRIDLSGFYDSPIYTHLSGQLRRGIQTIQLRVEHTKHPLLATDVWVADAPAPGLRKIVLAESRTIDIRARREGEKTLLRGLYPRLRGADGNWSETDGVLTIGRLDLTSDKASRWLRVMHVPEQGPVLFSDVIDLKQYADDRISIEAVLRPGVQLRGQLSEEVPRPVKDGRVVAAVYSGPDASDTVFWGDVAAIAPDGTFDLGPLPADDDAQLIAFCDGWVSQSPTAAEVDAYVETQGFELRSPYAPSQHFGMLHPRLHRLSRPVSQTVIPMERTSVCEVTVVDEDGKSIPEATVAFSQSQAFFRSGTFDLGAGWDSLAIARTRLATGAVPQDLAGIGKRSFTAKTNELGVAVISHLSGGWTRSAENRSIPISVWHADYRERNGLLPYDGTSVTLKPGETGRVTVQLLRR